ncbi:MAG TPA: PorP/SprF family type IX secretion system membrane protein [Bacteroidales bacterium]|nr:PorP/SprF family type IX secretion system membrane protein [Bacteroidales bacterium]
MRKAGCIMILLFLLVQGIRSQSDSRISLGYPVFSQYLQNGMMINPAYTGSRGALSAFLSYRKQWMGVKGSPDLKTLSLHTPMKNDRVGLGLMGQFMTYGYTKSSSLYASYAYHLKMRKSKLSLGLKAGFDRSNTDYAGIMLTSPGDPVFTSTDKPYMLPNISAGAYFFNEKYFAGISVPAFLSYNRTGSGAVQAYHSFNDYDFLISAGALIPFSRLIKFKPSILVDYSLRDPKGIRQLDINGNLIIGDLIWVGGSWRTSEEVAVGILQVQANPQLMIGFSYDYPVGRMDYFSDGFMNGSTEFIIRYEFGYKVSASNPRYF